MNCADRTTHLLSRLFRAEAVEKAEQDDRAVPLWQAKLTSSARISPRSSWSVPGTEFATSEAAWRPCLRRLASAERAEDAVR